VTEVTEVNQQKKKVVRFTGVNTGTTTLTITDTLTQRAQTLTVNISAPYELNSEGKLTSWKKEAISENIVIPSTITQLINNSPFNSMRDIEKAKIKTIVAEGLTAIPTMTFMAFENLTSVTLGANVTEIGVHAFARTEKLETFIIKATTPPTFTNPRQHAWTFSNKTTTLVVPKGAKANYENATGWKDHFKTIEEREF
ncbi:MAG: leucine-rich repeat protein, partial [Flavobacteriaceae bacterium]|nr:leucine-rich repeat protein [Flavobacteriaceae bacterium]